MSSITLKGLQGLNFLLKAEKNPPNSESFFKTFTNHLFPSPYQPRKNIKEDEIEELTQSIRANGIIQPIIVRKAIDGKYEIIAGERRWRAAMLANLKEVPVICRDISDVTVLAFALVENIQRKDLNAVDEAEAIKKLIADFSMTQEEIAQTLGKARSTIANLLRILNLQPLVKKMLVDEQLEIGHAKLLLGLDENDQIKIANIIAQRKLTVRETEKLINQVKNNPEKTISLNTEIDIQIQKWQELLSKNLFSKVSIKLNESGKGRVVINIESTKEIEWLIKKFEN